MTLAEFFGCAFLAFGAPLAMFTFTIVHDPIRIIILIAAAFFWLVALLLSSLIWFAVVPLRGYLAFGLVFSVLFQVTAFPYWNFLYIPWFMDFSHGLQEVFRFVIYKILRKTEKGLQEVADNVRVTENKHILAYVSGLGFGVISGAFAIINILADAVSLLF